MEPEIAVVEEQRPTDEQASAFLNGNRQAVEPQEAKPAAPVQEASAPAASQTAPAKTEIEILREELNRVKSEVGQFRKVRSELSQRKPEQNQVTPQSWAQMTPDEQKAWLELFDHTFQQKYGNDWNEFQELKEQRKIEAQISTVESWAKQFAGELHDKLDPIMGKIYADLVDKAQQGDEEAAQIVFEVKNTRSGVKYLVDLAKQEYGQSVEARGQQAEAARSVTAKKAGITLGQTTQQSSQTPDILKNLPKDPAKAAEMLREELIKRGAL